MKHWFPILVSCLAGLLLQVTLIAGTLPLNTEQPNSNYLSQSSDEVTVSHEWALDGSHPIKVSDCENPARVINESSLGSGWLCYLRTLFSIRHFCF